MMLVKKEQKDAELDRKIEALRKKNEALMKRYQVTIRMFVLLSILSNQIQSSLGFYPFTVVCAEAVFVKVHLFFLFFF